MFDHIRWKVFLRVNTQKKAELILRRISKELGDPIKICESKPYRKNPDLYEAIFTSPLGIKEIQGAVFQTLRRANRISYHWNVRPPQDYEGDKWDFAGSAEKKTKISGVEAVEFEIMNYE